MENFSPMNNSNHFKMFVGLESDNIYDNKLGVNLFDSINIS